MICSSWDRDARAGLALIAVVIGTTGCRAPLSDIDAEINAMMLEASADLGDAAEAPPAGFLDPAGWHATPNSTSPRDITAETIPTVNPPLAELDLPRADGTTNVMARLEQYEQLPEDSLSLDLASALQYAVMNAREHTFAEESYVIVSLQLLIERHQWGPRFFNDVIATVDSVGDDSLFDSSLTVVNDFRVTQRLPHGGEVSARALATAVEDLHQRVSGERTQTAQIILDANIPLLRGAGTVAREDRIQAERNLIYAARGFERFRRTFLFDIATEFLDLVVLQKSIVNSRRQLASFERLEERQTRLALTGRIRPFDADLAKQDTVFSRDRLIGQLENYRLAVDRFKVRIGIPAGRGLEIQLSTVDIPELALDMEHAVQTALNYRLDLQTTRDRVDDAERDVENARNGLLPDFDLAASISIPTDDTRDRAGLRFAPDDTTFQASATFGVPLDRRIEALQVRQAQIDLARSHRSYDLARDDVIVDVRRSIRDIDRSRFSLELQLLNIQIAEQRFASLEAAPDRATARDTSEAVDAQLRAEDDRDRADRDLKVAILRFLLNSGQMRVGRDGMLISL